MRRGNGGAIRRSRTAAFDLVALLCAERCHRATGVAAPNLAESDACNWDEFTRLIARHRVAGIVHRAVSESNCAVPDETRRFLAREAHALARDNLAYAAETVRLQRLFDGADIRAVFFKGVTLAQRAYGSMVVKHGKDIDFLVSRADVPRCISLLEGNGYRLWHHCSTLAPAQWRSVVRFQIEVAMLHSVTGLQIEPHWALTENPRLLSADEVMKRSGEHGEAVDGRPIRTFHPDDLFAYLCVHGARSGWFRLKWLADLNAFVGDAPPTEIMRLHRHAEGLGVGPCCAVALSLCAEVFGRTIPATITAQVDARWLLRTMRALFLSNLLRPDAPRTGRVIIGHLLLAASHGYLLSEIMRWSVSPADAIAMPLPRLLHFLYPLVRIPLFLRRRLMRAATGGTA